MRSTLRSEEEEKEVGRKGREKINKKDAGVKTEMRENGEQRIRLRREEIMKKRGSLGKEKKRRR